MLVNFERRVCFLLHPKTASRAMAEALREKSGFVPVTDHHACWREELWSDRRLVKRGLDPEIVYQFRDLDPRNFVYIFVIRNPFDTLASWYEDLAHGKHELGPRWYRKFIRAHPRLFPKDRLWMYLQDIPPGPTCVLRYEKLQEELRTVARLFRFPSPLPLKVVGQTLTRAVDYRDYYSPEGRAWVEENFTAEIEIGGYTFHRRTE